MRRLWLLFLLLLLIASVPIQAQSRSAWCGYLLIEEAPAVEERTSVTPVSALADRLPLLSRLTVDEQSDSNPADLFQVKLSIDGSQAIVEGCWLVMPTRDLILNWLALSGGEDQKQAINDQLILSLFAPDGSREDSAASVRQYLSEHLKDWEVPEE